MPEFGAGYAGATRAHIVIKQPYVSIVWWPFAVVAILFDADVKFGAAITRARTRRSVYVSARAGGL